MKVLALDVGIRRIGVAVSDPTGLLARSLVVIHRRDLASDITEIAGLVSGENAELVVVGLPITLRGEIGPQAHYTLAFIEALRGAVETPVKTWDESYSTVAAEGALRSQGVRGRRQRERIDAAAAAVILQGYLDARSQPSAKESAG